MGLLMEAINYILIFTLFDEIVMVIRNNIADCERAIDAFDIHQMDFDLITMELIVVEVVDIDDAKVAHLLADLLEFVVDYSIVVVQNLMKFD